MRYIKSATNATNQLKVKSVAVIENQAKYALRSGVVKCGVAKRASAYDETSINQTATRSRLFAVQPEVVILAAAILGWDLNDLWPSV